MALLSWLDDLEFQGYARRIPWHLELVDLVAVSLWQIYGGGTGAHRNCMLQGKNAVLVVSCLSLRKDDSMVFICPN